jgi:hypothetical protein
VRVTPVLVLVAGAVLGVVAVLALALDVPR